MGTILYHTDTSIDRIGSITIPHWTNKYQPYRRYVAFFKPWQVLFSYAVTGKQKATLLWLIGDQIHTCITWHDSGKGFFCLTPNSLDCILPLDNVIWFGWHRLTDIEVYMLGLDQFNLVYLSNSGPVISIYKYRFYLKSIEFWNKWTPCITYQLRTWSDVSILSWASGEHIFIITELNKRY